MHLYAICRFPHWWGGWAFGPRFMIDVLPGLFFPFLRVWQQFLIEGGPLRRTAFAAVACLGIGIHTVQGLHSKGPLLWTHEPNIDHYPEYIFDWHYPAFLYTRAMHRGRLRTHAEEYLPVIEAGARMSASPERFRRLADPPCAGFADGTAAGACEGVEMRPVPGRHVFEGRLLLERVCGDAGRVAIGVSGIRVHEAACAPEITVPVPRHALLPRVIRVTVAFGDQAASDGQRIRDLALR